MVAVGIAALGSNPARLDSPRSSYHRRVIGGGKARPVTSSNPEPGLRRQRHRQAAQRHRIPPVTSARKAKNWPIREGRSLKEDLYFLALHIW